MGYVLYPGFTGLDLVGPYEVISRRPPAHRPAPPPRRVITRPATPPASARRPRRPAAARPGPSSSPARPRSTSPR
ncbi:hypothetical protein DMH08_13880 [Actinomadura sp. WAC 06369]|nr:hypothetical protein DMH08_13880 [Actinomadura sp. WAC 06369]